MPEPGTATTATLTAIGVTLTSLLTNLDAAVLVGATSGASLFVIQAKDLTRLVRSLYFVISLIVGYVLGPKALGTYLDEPALASFLFSACGIVLINQLIRGAEQVNFNQWIKPR